ncbi:hypothetical protein [Larkinella punicea]|nr:hypothetical protein [Larkinella punicea]
MKYLLILILVLLHFKAAGQSVKFTNQNSRKVVFNQPYMIEEIKEFFKATGKGVIRCNIRNENGNLIYILSNVGYLSELKKSPVSMYSIIEGNVILISSGIEPIIQTNSFFFNIVRPLVKHKIVDDLLPNGDPNPNAAPLVGFEPIYKTIFLKNGKIEKVENSYK